MKATEILMEEHQVILGGLAAGRALAARLRKQEDVGGDVRQVLEFFADFADHHHHAKEEEILFPWMESQGMPRDTGPLACMLKEHNLGRTLVSRARAALANLPESGEAIASDLDTFADLLEGHIMKEDTILFPMADRMGDGDDVLLPAYQNVQPDREAVLARHAAVVTDLLERMGRGKAAMQV